MILYNLSIYFYTIAIKIAAIFNFKAKLWIDGRKNIFKNLENTLDKTENIIWIHAASLGEFEQGRPLIEKIKQNNPNQKILLTFFSPSGYEVRKNYELADFVFYLPADTPYNAKRFIKIVSPAKIYFIKYEFWQNYLKQAYLKKIPIYLVSGIFRENQIFFKPYGKYYRKVLDYFTYFFVQNKTSENLLKKLGYNNVFVAGDTRFDRVYDIAKNSKDITVANEFTKNKFTIVAGSSWQADEILLFEFMKKHSGKIKLILAPHEIKQSNIKRIQESCPAKSILFSEANASNISDKDVLIINNIGMLSSLYKYGNIAYIGGGFGAGIHNVLEAAIYGIPVIFGKKYKKFNEAVNLINRKAAFSINNYQELESILNKLIDDKLFLESAGNESAKYVKENIGAVNIILNKTF